jgi:hypothetical protein
VTLREVLERLDEFGDDETIYAEALSPTARAVGLAYVLEVTAAREAIEVWCDWWAGQASTPEDKIAAVTYYAQNDAWLPVE